MLNDRRRGGGERVERVGVIAGFQLVFKAVAIRVRVAILAEAAEIAKLEPVGQVVGVIVSIRGYECGNGGSRGRHGDAGYLVA